MKKQENQKAFCNGIDDNPVNDLWNNGIIYAFEFVRGHKKALSSPQVVKDVAKKQVSKKPVSSHELSNSLQSKMNKNNSRESPPLANSRVGQNNLECDKHSQDSHSGRFGAREGVPRNCWEPIGWDGILELVQTVQVDACGEEPNGFTEDDDDVTVADVAAPYWERPVGPTCSFLLYSQVPVRVACGLLFELLGQSAGDPLVNEDDIPVVLRSWQSQNFLVTALHVKGSAQNVNVLGISEVQELLAAEGISMPRNIHEVIAHLACRLACWDDRLYRKFIFGAADEVELKFMNRRTHEDMYLFSIILNQEIRWLSTQVIRVKWSLHAREEIMFELLHHLRGDAKKEYKGNDSRARSCSRSLIYYSRCDAEHCSRMVAGLHTYSDA